MRLYMERSPRDTGTSAEANIFVVCALPCLGEHRLGNSHTARGVCVLARSCLRRVIHVQVARGLGNGIYLAVQPTDNTAAVLLMIEEDIS